MSRSGSNSGFPLLRQSLRRGSASTSAPPQGAAWPAPSARYRTGRGPRPRGTEYAKVRALTHIATPKTERRLLPGEGRRRMARRAARARARTTWTAKPRCGRASRRRADRAARLPGARTARWSSADELEPEVGALFMKALSRGPRDAVPAERQVVTRFNAVTQFLPTLPQRQADALDTRRREIRRHAAVASTRPLSPTALELR